MIKKAPLYPKIQKIKKEKNKNSQTSTNEIKFYETNLLTHSWNMLKSKLIPDKLINNTM